MREGGIELKSGTKEEVRRDRSPKEGHHIPNRPGTHLMNKETGVREVQLELKNS